MHLNIRLQKSARETSEKTAEEIKEAARMRVYFPVRRLRGVLRPLAGLGYQQGSTLNAIHLIGCCKCLKCKVSKPLTSLAESRWKPATELPR